MSQLAVLATQLVDTHTHVTNHIAAATKNPFDGVAPDFSIFGANFNSWWKKLLAGAWGLAIVYCGFKLFPAAMSLQHSKRVGNAGTTMEKADELKTWGVSTLVIVAAGLIMGVILAAAG